jgi:fibronectin type 3 domain-containing protein
MVLIGGTSSVHAQSDSLYIGLIAKPKKDGVWLRWAPANPIVWRLGNQHGYTVERFTLRSDGEIENPLGDRLTEAPIRHLTEPEMSKLAETTPEVAVVQEVMFGENAKSPVPPSDDPRSVLARNQEMENEFGMALLMCDQSTLVAQATGLFMIDKTAETGKRYIYRVSIAVKTAATVQPGVTVLTVTNEKPLLTINNLKATFGNRSVTLSWPTLLHLGVYSAYYIEKSTDGKTFKRLSELPFVYMNEQLDDERASLVDSLENNVQKYFYRIIGLSPFGEEGQPSNIVSGIGKDDLTGILIIREATLQGKNNVRLSWEFPEDMEKKISAFVVERASAIEGPYKNLLAKLTPSQRKFTDVTTSNYNYYRLKAIDKSGEMLCQSFPYYVLIADTIPPATPTGITGRISNEGLVTLQWNKNSEPDLLGYRVFYANNPKHEFTETTTEVLVNPQFTDTVSLEVLNKAIYFSVASVDKNYNPSVHSKPIKLIRPDKVAPAAPVFTKAMVQNNGVYLEWINSVSDDVKSYRLERQEVSDTAKVTVMQAPGTANKTSFLDDKATMGKSYKYLLAVADSSGNTSVATTGKIRFETGFRPPVTNVQSTADRDNVSITLRWKTAVEAVRYFIYRKVNDSAYILYHTTDTGTEMFIDKGIPINNTYYYKIQAVHQKGVKSALSEEIVVKF